MKILTAFLLLTMTIFPPKFDVEFSRKGAGKDWRIVNDGVMGGRSTATFEISKNGTGIFQGNISLENNGGFSSLRSPIDQYDLSGYDGLEVRLKTDGRKYGITLDDKTWFNGVYHHAYFPTEDGEWMEIRIPFDEVKTFYFGRELGKEKRADLKKIKEVGIILMDKKEGPFRVELDWVRGYRDK